MLIEKLESQLLLIDYQARLMPAIHEGTDVLQRATTLAHIASLLQVPVWATEQNPDRLGSNDEALRALCSRTLPKMSFSGVDDELLSLLRPPAPARPAGNARSLPKHLQKPQPARQERNTIMVAGCETHVCLLQTALDLLDEEFDVCVVTDACGSRRERDRDAAFDRLAGAGAELVTVEMVAFEWLRSAADPHFKEVLPLIR